jgi:hypothetical protein
MTGQTEVIGRSWLVQIVESEAVRFWYGQDSSHACQNASVGFEGLRILFDFNALSSDPSVSFWDVRIASYLFSGG